MRKKHTRSWKSLLLGMAAPLLGLGTATAQNPTSVDIDLVAGGTPNTLEVYVRANGQGFSDVVSGVTFTIQWPATSPATLGTRTQYCAAGFSLSPTTEVTASGSKFRTYNAFGSALLIDECPDEAWPANTWHRIMSVPVTGNTGCTPFQIVSNFPGQPNNTNYFVSLGGVELTGNIEATAADIGDCAPDCPGLGLNVGDSCNDGNPNTSNDVVTAACECVGTAGVQCPGLGLNIGDPCNDGNANTTNDIVTPACECVGTPPTFDCPGLGLNIGDPCNDGNPNTSGDEVTAACECVGDPIFDCPTLSLDIGDPCNDANACTINDVVTPACVCVGTTQDTDGDGICNAEDNCPNLAGEQGDACNDGNPNTDDDIITPACVCAGQENFDCPGLGLNIGDPCNDGNPNTSDDAVTAACECVGDPIFDCPTLGLNIGDVCNDANACTINDVVTPACVCVGTTQDTDGDGICNAEDNCPNLAGEQGDACNDGNPNTDNDIITPACVCAGQESFDCPGLGLNIGDPCNDGNPNTSDDAVTAACECVGDPIFDCPTLGLNIGDVCNDANACTINDVVTPACVCVGTTQDTDGDGICNAEDNCPNLAGEQGDACDDGNPNSGPDVITVNCVCAGPLTNDCEGVPGGPAQPGTACDDADACTSDDVWSAACVCGGTAVAGPTMGAVGSNSPICVGTSLNLTASATGAGTITYFWTGPNFGSGEQNPTLPNPTPFNSGTFIVTASNGCGTDATGSTEVTVSYPPNAGTNGTLTICSSDAPAGLLEALNGSPSVNGTWTFGGNAHGDTYDPATDAPGDYLYTVFGQGACDDVSATVSVTENAASTWYADTDGDGLGDLAASVDSCSQPTGYVDNADDNCPDLSGVQGDACDDGNPDTSGDVITASCVCAGVQDIDCEGVPGGPAQPGTSCDDADACTTNDVYDANCDCAGTFADGDGDGICDANDPCDNNTDGDVCDDGDACTINDALDNCVCAGVAGPDTDGDGILDCNDNCPNLAGVQGDACDDGNPDTSGDVITVACVCAGVQDIDCEGVPGGPAQPGTSCDDADACTTNDVYDANCDCAGTFADGDGDGICDANDPCDNNTDGDVCDDGDACTINDALDNCVCAGVAGPDTDGDGILDCNDNCPNLAGVQGDACDDGNPDTSGDVITVACVCAGVQDIDCEGVPGGPAQPGTACDDADACTTNDVYDVNCVCAGTFQDGDGDGICDANDPCDNNTDGDACDDGDACTINDALDNCVCVGTFQDSDGDGTCDADDACPLLADLVNGDLCDDGNANTENDMVTDCICAGQPIGVDCEGTPGGTELPGTDCDDADACTINDLWSASCECEGTYQDTDGDGICNASDNCPNLSGVQGDACDDGNANTTLDVITASCVCQGTPIGGCTENLTLSITLDANGSQTSWTLYDATEVGILDQGGPYTNGTPGAVINEPICVPVGCYHLRFSDSGNDGITGGGYVLSNASSKRIIDASMGSFTSTSELGGTSARTFCVPIGGLQILNNWCDRSNLLITSPVYCNSQPGATGYQWWIYNPHGSYNRRVTTTTNSLAPANLNTNPVPTNTWLNIRVRPVFNGPASEFGPACRIRFVPNQAGPGRELLFDEATNVTMSLYPNPNRDGLVTLSMEGVDVADETMVDIDVYDMVGKRVFTERAVAAEGIVNHRMDLSARAGAGLYMVNVTIEGKLYTQRLVIQ